MCILIFRLVLTSELNSYFWLSALHCFRKIVEIISGLNDTTSLQRRLVLAFGHSDHPVQSVIEIWTSVSMNADPFSYSPFLSVVLGSQTKALESILFGFWIPVFILLQHCGTLKITHQLFIVSSTSIWKGRNHEGKNRPKYSVLSLWVNFFSILAL